MIIAHIVEMTTDATCLCFEIRTPFETDRVCRPNEFSQRLKLINAYLPFKKSKLYRHRYEFLYNLSGAVSTLTENKTESTETIYLT